MIWVSDADKICNFFNKSWLDHTGRTPTFMAPIAENGWAEDVHPEDIGRCLKIYDEAFDNHREFTMEYRLRRMTPNIAGSSIAARRCSILTGLTGLRRCLSGT